MEYVHPSDKGIDRGRPIVGVSHAGAAPNGADRRIQGHCQVRPERREAAGAPRNLQVHWRHGNVCEDLRQRRYYVVLVSDTAMWDELRGEYKKLTSAADPDCVTRRRHTPGWKVLSA